MHDEKAVAASTANFFIMLNEIFTQKLQFASNLVLLKVLLLFLFF